MEDCAKWLLEYLKESGMALCDVIRDEAKKRGFNRGDLKKARKILGVKTFHQFDEGGATENWFWYLG